MTEMIPAAGAYSIDGFEIWQLTTRYAAALDAGEWEALAGIFGEDGVMDFAHVGEVRGWRSIAEVCAKALDPLDASQHLVGTHVIDVAGDSGTVSCYFQAQHVRGEGQHLVAGTYRDEVHRTAAGWRIARRTQRVTWTSGDASVLGG
ncbi:nuclear transport factor 2 family protein [Gordonia aurantiaca]|uniref:nuclear transport factor 2 family protein n=1 Tax=Gordonia sp. B21 TaxID=3151852 RepID=UPI003265CE5D